MTVMGMMHETNEARANDVGALRGAERAQDLGKAKASRRNDVIPMTLDCAPILAVAKSYSRNIPITSRVDRCQTFFNPQVFPALGAA